MRSRTSITLAAAIGITLVMSGCSPSARPTSGTRTEPAPTPVATFGSLPTSSIDPAKAAALQRALDAAIGAGSDDALATVITPDGIWSGAAGVDGPHGRKAQPDDVVSIASITKTFTAALVFKLAEEKRIDLDAKLSTYLDAAAAAKSNGATVRQALAMRAGLPDTTDASREAALKVPTRITTVDEIVAVMPPPTGKPGSPPEQSNPTYKLLALAAEKAGGLPWADLVRTELVEPAHVHGTLLVQVPGVPTPGPWALPTEDGPWGVGGTLPFVADTSFSHGSTDMAADTRSLAVWAAALLAGRIVSPASLAEMADTGGTDIGSGLDPFFGGVPEGSLGHLGNKDGYSTVFVADPATQSVVVVAMNATDQPVDSVAGTLLQAIAS